jgi:hypothetical protein
VRNLLLCRFWTSRFRPTKHGLGKSTQVSWQLICPPLHDYIHAFYCIIHHYFSSMHVDVILFLALYNTTLMWYQTAAQICSLLYRATLTCFGAIFRWQHHQKAPPTRCTAHTCASFCVCIVAHSFPWLLQINYYQEQGVGLRNRILQRLCLFASPCFWLQYEKPVPDKPRNSGTKKGTGTLIQSRQCHPVIRL